MYNIFKLHRTEDDWLQLTGQVLMTWSIFNPNGPTLKCLGTRETGANGEQEVFYRWMHFLGGGDYCLGYFNNREEDWGQDLGEIIWHAFSADASEIGDDAPLVNTVPSFVTSTFEDQWADFCRDQIFQAAAMREADWGREQYYLQKYGNALFDRAGEEIREAYEGLLVDPDHQSEESNQFLRMMYAQHEHIPSFMNWKPGRYQSRALAEDDIKLWWDTVTTVDFGGVSAIHWAAAWAGGAAQSGLESQTRFEDVRDFLTHFEHGLWPSDYVP